MAGSSNDDSRILQGPGDLRIFVPYRPARAVSDLPQDLPPFEEVVVWVSDYKGNYFAALREGRIQSDDQDYKFSTEKMEWLNDRKRRVDSMRMDRKR